MRPQHQSADSLMILIGRHPWFRALQTVIRQCGEACLAQFGSDIAFVGVTISGDDVNDYYGGIAIPYLFGEAQALTVTAPVVASRAKSWCMSL